ncbi:MAG: hypothetical protein ACRDQ2_13020, partial [Gaiellales bacterium]
VEESAERAAREAAAGAVALGAQKEAALSAERSAKAADAALKAAQREAEARVTQEQAALAAESSAEASLHAAEAARAALAHSVEQIEAVINDRENAQTSFGEARTLLETALAKMDYTLGEITDMVARFGVAQAKVLDDQQQALSETQVAARAAQGAARAAQASSVAAQRDATRALKAVVAFAERDEEHTIIRLDANGHDDPAPGTDVLTPWDELAEQDGLEVDPLWAPIDELTNGERLDLYGDEEPPLLERILTKLRPDRED